VASVVVVNLVWVNKEEREKTTSFLTITQELFTEY